MKQQTVTICFNRDQQGLQHIDILCHKTPTKRAFYIVECNYGWCINTKTYLIRNRGTDT